jgi:hypothetical protein
MSFLHLNLLIMMIFVERRAVADGEALDAHSAAHAAGADHLVTPASHLSLQDG